MKKAIEFFVGSAFALDLPERLTYNGKITADNGDGTFGIEYDDGDWEDELKAEYIQVISKKKKDALENLQNKEENQIHPEAQLVVDKAIIDVNPSIAADPESRKDTITAAHADAEKIVINALREVDAHISAQAHELVSHQPNGFQLLGMQEKYLV